MSNSRAKGLGWVREVKKMLIGIGHQVEGPAYGVAYFNGKMNPIHRDYFGVADLISCFEGKLILHQVTDLSNKAVHQKAIQEKNLSAWIWCRLEGKVEYRIFFVTPDKVEEGEARFKI